MAEARRIEELTPEELAEVERAESELDAFVTKRAEQAKEVESTAALWLKTEREHREKKRSATSVARRTGGDGSGTSRALPTHTASWPKRTITRRSTFGGYLEYQSKRTQTTKGD